MATNEYTAVFSAVAVTAGQDLFSIQVPAGKSIEILYCTIGQSSDAGDSAAELLPWSAKTFTGAFSIGTGGSAPTPVNRNAAGKASGCTVRVNDTSQTSGGTASIHHSDVFNVQAGLVYPPVPNIAPMVSAGNAFVLSLDGSPADSLTTRGTIAWREKD